MKTIFNSELNAELTLDDEDRVRHITHSGQYWISDRNDPVEASIQYIEQNAGLIRLQSEHLKNLSLNVSHFDPMEQGIEYHLSEEKKIFDSTTVSFYQTFLNVPIWQAGITVTVKSNPYRIISFVNTSQDGVDAKLPAKESVEFYRNLFNLAKLNNESRKLGFEKKHAEPEPDDFIRSLIDSNAFDKNFAYNTKLIRGRFFVYKYNESNRFPQNAKQIVTSQKEDKQGKISFIEDQDYVLPLLPVDESIKEDKYYLVAEVSFSFSMGSDIGTTWVALVEIETRSVLYHRSLSANIVRARLFLDNPVALRGDTAITPIQTSLQLNAFREEVTLYGLTLPAAGVQSLRGRYATITNISNPIVAAPTNPSNVSFNYDVRTDNFSAVSAYYHVDRFFRLIASLGFQVSSYFNNTTFPIQIDHRGAPDDTHSGNGVDVNAHCVGNGMGGIGHVCYALFDLGDTTNPIGIALDWRVTLHELGGHGILYEHVNSPNFGFAHSAGDSLAVILNDPTSRLTGNDRFRMFPWVVDRRCDRDVSQGWAWGGSMDMLMGPMDNRLLPYRREEILATSLFRIYLAIGGNSTDVERRRFASRMMAFLILAAINTLTESSNPTNASQFADALIRADRIDWTTAGISGAAYKKVIRWAFEKQGLYQSPSSSTPVTSAGLPPDVDVYIDDGRGGEYQYEQIHWMNKSIWNRRQRDGATNTTHEPPALNVTNYAYVIIKNRGPRTAQNVRVRGAHCRPSAGVVWPSDFQNMSTGVLEVGPLAGNNSQELIVGPFEWTPIRNAYGHDCVLMILSTDQDLSNVESLTALQTIPDWRLVPNDNNIGQRNMNLVAGGNGSAGLLGGLDGYSFWVKNHNSKASIMELRVKLPEFMVSKDWTLSFKGIADNKFKLGPDEQNEVFISLGSGKDFDKQEVENSESRDITIFAYADDALIGGITYRLDPEIKELNTKETEKTKS